jgi:hypothetical protein
LFSTSGLSVSLPALVGDSIIISTTTAYQNFWNRQRIRTVAILQETGSHALIQSELSSVNKTGDVTGLDPWEENTEKLKVFPNPVDHTLFIENPINNKPLHIYLLNTLGEKLLETTGYVIQWDLSQLPSGVYYVVNSETNFAEKIVIQHP